MSNWYTPADGEQSRIRYGAGMYPADWIPAGDRAAYGAQLLTALLEAVESWWAARVYGDGATQAGADAELEEAAGRWLGCRMVDGTATDGL